jgi:HD-GYP domain-containing protein (c-di-GMP phosphodiesterase class II)
MRLVPTTTLPEGALLARDVLVGRPDGVPLLRAGVRITPDYRSRLLRVGIRAVYIEDEIGAGIAPEALISTETRRTATRLVSDAFAAASEAMLAKQLMPQKTIVSLQEIVKQILADVASSAGAAMALVDLAAADTYTFQHSIDVTALGLLLGDRLFRERGWLDFRGVRQFHRFEERLHLLGLGLLLHDVGKLALPGKLIQKPEKLTPDEWELIRSHPRLGLELLRGDDFSPLVKAIVLRHHERWDGSGYPDGKSGTEIHEMARIAAVADVYDAITSERPYAAAQPAREGVRVILEGSGTLFDPDVVNVFARVVTPFPPGEELRLADGRRAVVVSVAQEALHRPLVRVIEGPGAPYDLALAHEPAIAIDGWGPSVNIAAAAA